MKISKTEQSRLTGLQLENIPFGSVFTDHMLVADYADGEWGEPRIEPYGPLQTTPANAAWHYGQAIFEGIKAYPYGEDKVAIFRGIDNFRRFKISAHRLAMPAVPEEIFMDGMKTLIDTDRNWMPRFPEHAMYIRPFMVGWDNAIGVRPSNTYKFMIILSPSGPYFSAPMRIWVEKEYVRAVKGGVGFAKAAGNYALSMFPTAEARRRDFDQVLWTDATHHRYVQEIGVMNVFFVVGDEVWTPGLGDGTILAGITRDSVIKLLKEKNIRVREEEISIDELVAAYKENKLTEVFGAGTAATISMIKQLSSDEFDFHFDLENAPVSNSILNELNDMRYGRLADTHNWLNIF